MIFKVSRRRRGLLSKEKLYFAIEIRHSSGHFSPETDGVISYHIEGSTYPNWKGTQQERLFKLSADELTLTNSTTSIGAGTAYSVWIAAK